MGRVRSDVHSKFRATTRNQAEIIFRVRRYFEKERQEGKRSNLNQVVVRTCEATGFSKKVVSKIKTEDDVENWKFEDGQKLIYGPSSVVPDNYQSLLRYAVREVILEKIKYPTIDSILQKLRSIHVSDIEHLNLFDIDNMPDPEELVWKWSRATLHRFMQKHGFIFEEQVSHYEHTKTREDIVSMRDNYLEWISKYRDQGYQIFYQDETWVFKNMSPKKVWKDTAGNSTQDMPRKPSGSGDRSILSHVCSENLGLLENCLLLFQGSKSDKNSDYHSEMNWLVFSDWCENKVFPAIQKTGKKSVLVLDRATYHTVLDEEDRKPTQTWNKSRLSFAIRRWGGAPTNWPDDWEKLKTKSQLLEHARKIYPQPKCKIQKIADKFTNGSFELKIIFLPVAHPELNPIELVWSSIKRHVSKHNQLFRLSEVERLTKEKIQSITVEEVKQFTSHALKEEEKYKKLSTVADNEDLQVEETETESSAAEEGE